MLYTPSQENEEQEDNTLSSRKQDTWSFKGQAKGVFRALTQQALIPDWLQWIASLSLSQEDVLWALT